MVTKIVKIKIKTMQSLKLKSRVENNFVNKEMIHIKRYEERRPLGKIKKKSDAEAYILVY
jgi:hypothetical protein